VPDKPTGQKKFEKSTPVFGICIIIVDDDVEVDNNSR